MATPDIRGAGILLVYRGHVLLGKESTYLSDTMANVTLEGTLRSLKGDLEKTKQPTFEFAKRDFGGRAGRLSKALGYRVQYDQPEGVPGLWTTNYRILRPEFKYGIPKGRRKDEEPPIKTAQREFSEEIGGELPEARFVPFGVYNNYQIYRVEISDDEFRMMNAKIKERKERYYSELFDIEFIDMTRRRELSMNSITRQALSLIAGRRRKSRRKSRMFKVPKTLKKTIR